MSKYEVTNEAIPIEANIFGDVYKYYRFLYNGDNSEDYINEVYRGFEALKQKYNDDPLCMSLLVAVTTDLQHPERRPNRYNAGGNSK